MSCAVAAPSLANRPEYTKAWMAAAAGHGRLQQAGSFFLLTSAYRQHAACSLALTRYGLHRDDTCGGAADSCRTLEWKEESAPSARPTAQNGLFFHVEWCRSAIHARRSGSAW